MQLAINDGLNNSFILIYITLLVKEGHKKRAIKIALIKIYFFFGITLSPLLTTDQATR